MPHGTDAPTPDDLPPDAPRPRPRKRRSAKAQSDAAEPPADGELRSAFGRWFGTVRGHLNRGDQASEAEFCTRVRASVLFAGRPVDDHRDARRIFSALARGKELLSSALAWETPLVGKSDSRSSGERGLQWRAVIAWSGLEQILRELIPTMRRSDLDSLVATLELPLYRPLDPPRAELASLRSWREGDTGDDEHGINGFLQAESQETRRTLRSWLIAGRPQETWTDSLVLTKVLRHVTAHGALSASKVRQWGLIPVFSRLIPETGIVAAALFRKMAAESLEDDDSAEAA